MNSVAIIDAISPKLLNDHYHDWQKENPDEIITSTKCTSVLIGTGSYPGISQHFIFIFYKKKTLPTKIG
ncbi:MAG: hypothetical protein UR95_C0006G0178 [Parcubacteria group bacterium GW2011_GWC1_36_108]|nr:MAG: hypothetical protein UR95_C0006G0178 [Parcubacteria group bacterium GW2011_GWC1_36_108]